MNIEINGVNLQADFMDAEFMDKLEPALAEVQKKLNHGRTQNYESVGAAYRELNGYIERFLMMYSEVGHLTIFLRAVRISSIILMGFHR